MSFAKNMGLWMDVISKKITTIFTNFNNSGMKGLGWMVLSGFCFVAVTVFVRIVGPSVPPAQAAFLRFLIGLAIFLPFLYNRMKTKLILNNILHYFLRGAAHAIGIVLWFFAVVRLPIAEVTAVGYITPIFVTIGAIFAFKESVSIAKIMGIAVAFLGVIILLRPGFQEIAVGTIAQIFSTLFFASSFLLAKGLTKKEDPFVIVAMLTLMVTIALAPFAIISWVEIKGIALLLLALIALLATAGHFFMTKAFQEAPMVLVQPITFLQLVWSVLLGVMLFNEKIDLFVLLGGALIILAITSNVFLDKLSK